MMDRHGYAAELGLRDLAAARLITLLQILAFAAVMTPLIVLWGLKQGVIDRMVGDLMSDPDILQVDLRDPGRIPADRIADWRRDPLIGFAQGHILSLGARVEFIRGRGRSGPIEPALLLASGDRDPLLPPDLPPPGRDEVVLTQSLADALDVAPGAVIEAVIDRREGLERVFQPLTVTGIVDRADWTRSGALIALDTLQAIGDFRNGFAVPARGWPGERPAPDSDDFASARLYAASLAAMRPLIERLTAGGYRPQSRLAEIEGVLALERALDAVFGLMAVLVGGGFALAFAAQLWANILRKRHEISLLRLQGMSRGAVAAFPLAQALAIAGLAALIAIGAAPVGCARLGQVPGLGFAQSDGGVCALGADALSVSVMAALAVAALAAVLAVGRVTRIDPAEGLRHV